MSAVDQFGHRLEAPGRLPLSTADNPTWVVRPFDVSGYPTCGKSAPAFRREVNRHESPVK